MDIRKIEQAAAAVAGVTFRVPLEYHEDGTEHYGVLVVGRDSPEFQACTKRLRISGFQRMAAKKGKAGIDVKTVEGATEFDALAETNNRELALACTVGWWGVTDGDDEGAPEAPYDAAMVGRMYAARPTWQEKVRGAIETDENFSKPSLSTSTNS